MGCIEMCNGQVKNKGQKENENVKLIVSEEKLLLLKNFQSIHVELETDNGVKKKYLLRRTSKGKLILV